MGHPLPPVAVLPLVAVAVLLAQASPDLEQTCGPAATGVLQVGDGETWCFLRPGEACRAADVVDGRCTARP
jgi:hypothetical protein